MTAPDFASYCAGFGAGRSHTDRAGTPFTSEIAEHFERWKGEREAERIEAGGCPNGDDHCSCWFRADDHECCYCGAPPAPSPAVPVEPVTTAHGFTVDEQSEWGAITFKIRAKGAGICGEVYGPVNADALRAALAAPAEEVEDLAERMWNEAHADLLVLDEPGRIKVRDFIAEYAEGDYNVADHLLSTLRRNGFEVVSTAVVMWASPSAAAALAAPSPAPPEGPQRTRFFIDTEFIEDGERIHPLAVAVVTEDGDAFYAVVTDVDRSLAGDWVKANVLPYLGNVPEDGEWLYATRSDIAAALRSWVAARSDAPEFWADYGAYDWVLICQLFGTMLDLPDGWPMFVRDIQQLRNGEELPQPEHAHQAVSDALCARDRWRILTAAAPASTGTPAESAEGEPT